MELHRAGADVVEDRVAEDVVERVLAADVLRARADDDAELDLVVDREPVLGELRRPVRAAALITSSAGGITIGSPGPTIALASLMKSQTTSSGKTKPGSSSPWLA